MPFFGVSWGWWNAYSPARAVGEGSLPRRMHSEIQLPPGEVAGIASNGEGTLFVLLKKENPGVLFLGVDDKGDVLWSNESRFDYIRLESICGFFHLANPSRICIASTQNELFSMDVGTRRVERKLIADPDATGGIETIRVDGIQGGRAMALYRDGATGHRRLALMRETPEFFLPEGYVTADLSRDLSTLHAIDTGRCAVGRIAKGRSVVHQIGERKPVKDVFVLGKTSDQFVLSRNNSLFTSPAITASGAWLDLELKDAIGAVELRAGGGLLCILAHGYGLESRVILKRLRKAFE